MACWVVLGCTMMGAMTEAFMFGFEIYRTINANNDTNPRWITFWEDKQRHIQKKQKVQHSKKYIHHIK